ncbi:MAG: sugar phosphate isomerase [Bacteroidetes bacterium OLB12]|nr:MAG: sugar phosphate isomerase [Bacteroidetes bacterium OLB12]
MKKQISRKEFIRLSTITTLALPVLGYTACSSKKEALTETQTAVEAAPSIVYSDRLGMQVFGVRELLEKDPQGVFKAIAEIGIKNIELFDPATLKTYVPIIKRPGHDSPVHPLFAGLYQWQVGYGEKHRHGSAIGL